MTSPGDEDDRFPDWPRQLGASSGAVWRRTHDAPHDAEVPVYALEPGGAQGVPTGLVFVRLGEGADVAAADRAFAEAGYAVERRPDWAPHTAWLRARSGRGADALAGIARLAALDGVVAVEPQMLVERRPR